MIADIFFITAQIIGFIAFLISTLKYQIRDARNILLTGSLGTGLWAVHVFMLGSIQAAIVNVIAVIRALLCLYIKEKYISHVVVVTFTIALLLTIPQIEKPTDTLPLLGFFFFGISCLFQNNSLLFRLSCIIGDATWIAYAIIIFSIPLAATCILSVLSSLIGLYRYEKQKIISFFLSQVYKTYP